MKLLVGVDGTERQHDAIALARLFADLEGSEIVLAHVYPRDWVVPAAAPLYEREVRDDARAIVDRAGEGLGRPFTARVVDATSPARGLRRLAQDERADVLVLASSQRSGIGRILPGGVGELVIHGSPCAVAMAPRGYTDGRRKRARIGVAYDGGAEAQEALAWAQDLARAAGAELTLYVVVETPALDVYPQLAGREVVVTEPLRDVEAMLARTLAGIPPDVRARGEIVQGEPGEALADAATQQDLLVAGSRGYGPLGAVLLGSVSRALLHAATTPVVVLPRTASTHTLDAAAMRSAAEDAP